MMLRLFYLMEVSKNGTFWEQVKQEFQDVLEMFSDFFLMIKEITYDKLVVMFGQSATDIVLVMVVALGIMLICMKIINR